LLRDKLDELARGDLGAGKAGEASALAALATAHEKLVRADRQRAGIDTAKPDSPQVNVGVIVIPAKQDPIDWARSQGVEIVDADAKQREGIKGVARSIQSGRAGSDSEGG
jgi:hypothetical protein